MKLKTAQLREWLDAHYRGEITYGRVVQNINEFFDQPDKPEWIELNGVAGEIPNVNAWLLDPNGVITFCKQDEYIPLGYYTHYLPIELPTPPQQKP